MADPRRAAWREKVDRVLGPPAWRRYNDADRERARKASDATRDFLAVIADDGPGRPGHSESEPAAFFERPATEAEEQARHSYLDQIGRISGAGDYPA